MKRLLSYPVSPRTGHACKLRRYHPTEDDFRSVLSDLAGQWERSGEEMAVYLPDRTLRTGTDFGILLEQAPITLHELEARRPYTISMYEQTAMLDIDIVPVGTMAQLTCRSWSSSPPCAWELELGVVLQDLHAAVALVQACVELAQNSLALEWIKEWRDGEAAP